MWEEGPRAIFLDMENLHDTSFDVLILFFKHCLAQKSELAAAQPAVSSAPRRPTVLPSGAGAVPGPRVSAGNRRAPTRARASFLRCLPHLQHKLIIIPAFLRELFT